MYNNSMNPELLNYIKCPRSGSRLSIVGEKVGSVVNGELISEDRMHRYPIKNGVPILFSDINSIERFTASNLGKQWKLFYDIGGLGKGFEEKLTKDFFHPINNNNVKNKTVLEAGCGYGRNPGIIF